MTLPYCWPMSRTSMIEVPASGGSEVDAEVPDAPGCVPGRNREVQARIFEHPLGIVGLRHRRLRAEQRAVEPGRLRQIVDADVDVHPLHATSLSLCGPTAHDAPPQQFSVR